jgi:putative transposase
VHAEHAQQNAQAYVPCKSMLSEVADDIRFPRSHQRRIRTANLLERLKREIKRRTRVFGIFPNSAACLRLISAFLMEKSEA